MSDKPENPPPPEPKVCTYCGHVYLKPCNGENPECENKKWVDQKEA